MYFLQSVEDRIGVSEVEISVLESAHLTVTDDGRVSYARELRSLTAFSELIRGSSDFAPQIPQSKA